MVLLYPKIAKTLENKLRFKTRFNKSPTKIPLPRIARIAVDAAAFERQQRKAGDRCLALWCDHAPLP